MNPVPNAPPEPHSLSLGPLTLWVHGRELPEATDYWDANWLDLTARCEGDGSIVHVRGPIVHASELMGWRRDIADLYASLTGRADLVPREPNLAVHLEAGSLGHIAIRVEISADPMAERHRFEDSTDQTFMALILKQLDSIIAAYPLVGLP